MNRLSTARNVAIIVVIAALVVFLPGGGRRGERLRSALWVGFGVGFGYIGVRLYREHRVAIYGLGDRHRALLYSGVAMIVFAWAARSRMWQSGAGELVWFLLVAFVVYALLEVYRHSRSY